MKTVERELSVQFFIRLTIIINFEGCGNFEKMDVRGCL